MQSFHFFSQLKKEEQNKKTFKKFIFLPKIQAKKNFF